MHHSLVRLGVSPRMTIHHRAMNLITAAEADTSQENNWPAETFTSGLAVTRSQSGASSDGCSNLPDMQVLTNAGEPPIELVSRPSLLRGCNIHRLSTGRSVRGWGILRVTESAA